MSDNMKKFVVMTTIELPETMGADFLFSANEQTKKASKFFTDAFAALVGCSGFIWEDVFIVLEQRDPELTKEIEKEMSRVLEAISETQIGSEEWANLVWGLALLRRDSLRSIIDMSYDT